MVAAFSRFVSRSTKKYKPFFQLLRKWKGFQWIEECDLAFKELKAYLMSLPILSWPDLEKDLYMYFAVSDHVISSVLLR